MNFTPAQLGIHERHFRKYIRAKLNYQRLLHSNKRDRHTRDRAGRWWLISEKHWSKQKTMIRIPRTLPRF